MKTTAMLTPRIRTLGASLRAARVGAHYGVRELARRIGVSPSLVVHWELGSRVPTAEDVSGVLGALGVVGDEKQRILWMARGAAEPGWITYGRPGAPNHIAGVLACEEAATDIVEWAPMVIPGLLQTPGYARALFTAGGFDLAEVERRVAVRMARRKQIAGSEAVPFHCLIGEAALHGKIGTPATMADQLRALAALTGQSTISLQVVPGGEGWHPGLEGRFVLFGQRNSVSVLYFEHLSSGCFVPDEYEVKQYREAVKAMRAIALSQEDSIELMNRLAAQLESRDEAGPPQA
ncbi:helix-turn-helix transcriptional regulator [Amycolatopsis sp. NPDC047767]|uniref:helix-turn-helix domain-containing protein n=1 Tax=Amycolatopsis sp. NPDC047767 TaxID=3156765 RepID=UPI0034536991